MAKSATWRKQTPIRQVFKPVGGSTQHGFILHDISSATANRDIQLFLEHHFPGIAAACHLPDNWPGARVLECMVEFAEGLFNWAESTCKFAEEDMFLAEERLNSLMDCSGNIVPEPQRQLDQIYNTVLRAYLSKSPKLDAYCLMFFRARRSNYYL